MLNSILYTDSSNGSNKWKNKTLYKIKKVQTEILRSIPQRSSKIDESVAHKDICATFSNQEAMRHSRAVRDVVHWLQETILAVNDEIKKLTVVSNNYNKFLYNIEVDQKINTESCLMRTRRPDEEKKLSDGTDDLLAAERVQLKHLARHVRVVMKTALEHLVNLNEARGRLIRVQNERTRVLDLLCHKTGSTEDRGHSKGGQRSMIFRNLDCTNLDNVETDPLSFYTPACKDAIHAARNTCNDSKLFREQIEGDLENIQHFRKKSTSLINNSFIHKLSETGNLKGQLQLARVRARSATNKVQRWHNYVESTMEFNRGPQKYQDLCVRERLDRPVIKVFQRHPGTQLPEAQQLIKIDNKLRSSVQYASGNIEQLQSIDSELYEDIKSKSRAMYIDSQTLRLRRCRSREMHCK